MEPEVQCRIHKGSPIIPQGINIQNFRPYLLLKFLPLMTDLYNNLNTSNKHVHKQMNSKRSYEYFGEASHLSLE